MILTVEPASTTADVMMAVSGAVNQRLLYVVSIKGPATKTDFLPASVKPPEYNFLSRSSGIFRNSQQAPQNLAMMGLQGT